MKLSHFTIIFLIIILPFSIIARNNTKEYFLVIKDQVRLNNMIDAATQDALDTLIDLNDEFQMLYIDQRFDVNQTLALEAVKSFFKTLAVNYNMPYIEGNTEAYFSMYIPAIVIIGYDGFFIYSVDENGSGGYAYQLSPKIPYSYVDEKGAIINFSLGNYIRMYFPQTGKFYEGSMSEDYFEESQKRYERDYLLAYDSDREHLNSTKNTVLNMIDELTEDMSMIIAALDTDPACRSKIPDFLIAHEGAVRPTVDYQRGVSEVASAFHQKRREVIIDIIRNTLQEEINSHSTYAKSLGSNYDFALPDIAMDDWTNSINDISVMSFVQGFPVGTRSYYNNYALGGSRIVETEYIYGTKDKIYHLKDCSRAHSSDVDNVFLNRVQAAENGYWPCLECRP